MAPSYNLALSSVGIFLAATMIGCGGSDLPKTSPVTGNVTYQGQPVEGANVIFSRGSYNIANGEVALGKTDAEGNFKLTTHIGGEQDVSGAVPGEYKVTISKFVPPKGISVSAYQAKVDAANKISAEGGTLRPGQEPPSLVEMLPKQYSVAASTKLSAKVLEDQANDFPFDLK
ncbi:carboxypeptidase-like regulatory domain-containing protein [Blastopirellula retiformator]|uniref:Nickel uptake substrate-specific transmembrane region n=1 Tax=Blastopirellula retiformator TaxID=2527970 RepID=A0A5C5VN07_9BACT|nr:carboxypeptidase-like regulatory domain-containing protein [Blastopirellula retiformator]TWT39275.1 hypothetical protein Enr8_09730 [Blastopirellula retiformator]